MFEWDAHNLAKIKRHSIRRREEFALTAAPILIYEQDADGEARYAYYGETGRMLAIVVTERDGKVRVVTAYELDAGQKKDYLTRRIKGE